MRHEHRAPFIASIVVVLACAGVLTHGMRTDALVGLARLNPLRPIASQLVEPAPVPTEAPRPQAARVLKPAAPPSAEAGATQQAEHQGQGRAGSGAPAQGTFSAPAAPAAAAAPAAPATPATPAAPAAAPAAPAAPVASAAPAVPAPVVPPVVPSTPPTPGTTPGQTRPGVGQIVSNVLSQLRGHGPNRGRGPHGTTESLPVAPVAPVAPVVPAAPGSTAPGSAPSGPGSLIPGLTDGSLPGVSQDRGRGPGYGHGPRNGRGWR